MIDQTKYSYTASSEFVAVNQTLTLLVRLIYAP